MGVSLLSAQSPNGVHLVRGLGGGLLMLSMRRIDDLVAFCAPYEFEDLVTTLTGADRVEPANFPALEFARRVYKMGRLLTRSRAIARAVTPRPDGIALDRDYDLFFPLLNNAYELFALTAVRDWRRRCRTAVCYVAEIWVDQVPEYLLELLQGFDHVFVGLRHAVESVARITGRPCSYLPLGVDALKFSPHPDPPVRAIDVCNIGRRSDATHDALLTLARERGLFYYYDTIRSTRASSKNTTFPVSKPAEHRFLLANLLKRTRYFIANRARANEPETTGGKDEISGRFFEGIAAGTILIGEPPNSDEFRKQFAWPDAVIPIPFDAPQIADVLAKLDGDPERVERIRRNNVVRALLEHDWVYRLRTVLEAAGAPPTEPMLAREARLRALAEQVRDAPAAIR